ncbi:MAG: SUMF1/EgtB/PvdO family nonheme iron enzyme [Myxococcales bacterium]|nr:SUMF1/EgtB/PvdO family nonheme iron enzyme [Myxococcales bacterium]
MSAQAERAVRASGRAGVVRVATPAPEAVEVPGGTFSMGLEPDAIELLKNHCKAMVGALAELCDALDEQFAGMRMRSVFVSRFAIGRREVTTEDYRECVAAGMCSLDPLVGQDGRYLRDEWPLVNVTWWEASEYCRWRQGRLPTEAEWERAARGDDTRAWPWGDSPRPADFNHGRLTAAMMRGRGNVHDVLGDPDDADGALLLAPPGSYPWGAGPFGTLDQAGNVAEWVYDAWSDTGYERLSGTNPVREPTLFDPRVVRGGSWRTTPETARVDARDVFNDEYLPDMRSPYVGFRCAWDRR